MKQAPTAPPLDPAGGGHPIPGSLSPEAVR
jgi:hypothetical protein